MSQYYLYVHQPAAVFKARANMPGAITYPITELVYDTVTVGAYTDVQQGMTLLLGTAEGLDDLGRVRVQNPPDSDSISIGRTSRGTHDGELDIQDNAYITALADFRVWAKIPFDAISTQYKDTNIAIGDNTTDIPPVANCGASTAGTIDSVTDLLTVEFDAVNSFAVADGATITDYTWDVDDGTITVGSSTTAAITATFPAGGRWVTLTVEDSNNKVHTARCFVYARDPDADTSITDFQAEITATPAGQQLQLTIKQDIAQTTYPDGTLVLMWRDEPSAADDRSHMLFTGWHYEDEASIRATRTGNLRDTRLTCLDVAGRLGTLPGFPQSVESAASPTQWTQMVAPTMYKYIHYLLYWHSTALEVSDLIMPATLADYDFVIFASEGESLHDQVNNECKGILPDHLLTCNRMGQLQVIPDPMVAQVVDRTATIQATFDEDDTANIRIGYMRPPRVHWLRGHALLIQSDYTTIDSVPTLLTVHCIAPGTAPSQGVAEQVTSEGIVASQAALNAVTGHRYARMNNRYGNLTVEPPDEAVFEDVDPATLDWVQLNLSATVAAQRGITFSNARCQVKEVRRRFEARREGTMVKSSYTLEVETSGYAATTVVPKGNPVSSFTPPLPDDSTAYAGDITGYILWDGTDVLRTWDLGAGSPTWERVDTGVSGTILDGQYMHISASVVGMWLMTTAGIFFCADIMAATPTWSNKLTLATVQAADATPSSGAVKFGGMTHYWSQPGHLCVATCPDAENDDYLHAYFWVTENYGSTWTQVDMNAFTFGSGATERCYYAVGVHGLASLRSGNGTIWAGRGNGRTGTSSGDAAIFKSTDLGYTWTKGHIFAHYVPLTGLPALLNPFPNATDPSYCVVQVGTGDMELYVSTDQWATVTNLTEPTGHEGGFDVNSQTQMVNKQTSNNLHILALFGVDSSSNADLYESDDSGSSWSLLENFGNSVITPNGWPPDVDQWVVIQNNDTPIIQLTLDNFGSLADKTGNLASVLSGGTWSSAGLAGGFALPKVGPNAD